MRPKVILLDWDGTLSNAFPLIWAAANATLIAKGEAPIDEVTAKTKIGQPLHKLFPDEQDRNKFIKEYDRISKETPPLPLPGAEELVRYLNGLRKRGLYVGIVSNKPKTLIEEEMKRFGWSGMFDTMVGSKDTPLPKPHPDALKKALENYPNREKLRAREITYIGDTNTDFEFASATGMRFVGVGDKISIESSAYELYPDLMQLHKHLKHQLRNMNTNLPAH